MAQSSGDGRSKRWQVRASNACDWFGRNPVAVDVVIPLALTIVSIGRFAADHKSGSVGLWLVMVGVLSPLALRRRAPEAVFATVTAVALLAVAIARELGPVLAAALLLALYTVAAHRTRRTALICAGLFEAWTVIALVRWAPEGEKLSAIVLMTGTATAAVMIGVNLQTRRAYLAALEDRAARLERERDQQARLAVAQERTRIAREVHDIVSHSLSVMVALADGAAATAPTSPPRAAGAMRQVADTGRQAIGEMRRMLGTLRTDEPGADRHPQPGIAQLEGLLAEVRAAGLPCRLTVEGRPRELAPGAQLAVYRIVQESLTNIRKHADGPTGARVQLHYLEESIELEIADDGRRNGAAAARPGHGVAGMRERAAAYGGTVDAGPVATGGWRVHTRLHLDEAERPR
jgi:signal transduction histidine kinase